MANFVSQIEFNAVDNVSATLNSILKRVSALGGASKKISAQFGQVSRMGGILASKLKYVGLAAAGVATSVFWMSYRVSESAEQMLNLSEKTGVSVESLQKFGYVADQANVGAESLTGAFKFLNRSIANAATTADSEAATAFAGLGIELKDANGVVKTTEQVFLELSDAFAGGADGPNKVRTAMALLGRAGADLIPLLNKGSEAIKKQGERFAKYGNLLGSDGLNAIKDFGDEVDNVKLAFKALGSIVATAVIPVLQPLVTRFGDWVASNKDLIKLKVTQWAQGIANAFSNLWPKVVMVWEKFSQLIEVIGGFENLIMGIAIFMGSNLIFAFVDFAKSVAMLSKVLLATPFGLVITSLALIGLAVYELNKAFPGLADAVAGTISIMAENFKEFFDFVLGGIKSVLEGLRLIDEEKNNQEGKNPGGPAAVTTVDPTTGKATTVFGGPITPGIKPPGSGGASTAPADQSGFNNILQMMADFANKANQPTDINLNLNTKNEVYAFDVDTAGKANVTLNSGPMVLY